MTTEPARYRLMSNDMVDTPGLIRWAINGYFFEDDQPQLRRVFTEGYGLPDDVTHRLRRELEWRVDEDNAAIVTVGADE